MLIQTALACFDLLLIVLSWHGRALTLGFSGRVSTEFQAGEIGRNRDGEK